MAEKKEYWSGYTTLMDKENGDIFASPWYKDLVKVCVNDGNLEEFITAKDKKRYESYLATDENLLAAKKSLSNYTEQKQQKDKEIENSQSAMDAISAIQDKINDVLNTFPPSKRGDIERVLKDFALTGNFDAGKIAAAEKSKGLWDRIKNAAKYKKGRQKLNDLIEDCKECKDIARNEPFKGYFKSVCNIENKESQKNDCQKALDRQKEESAYYQKNIENTERRIEKRISEFPAANIENQIIREFVADKKELFAHPPEMSDEEVKQNGLSEKYVESALLNSKYPQAAFGSMRRFYEELKDPVAPRVAFNHRSSGKNISPQEMVDKLREKGIDAVLSTDERAIDPNVFAVDENSIHAPFLSPKEALKANIVMVEAIKDLGNTPALSNPLMRESMVKAVEQEKGNQGWGSIDNFQKNLRYNQENLKNVLGETFINWGKDESYSKHFDAMMKDMQNKDPEAYKKIYVDAQQNLSKYVTRDAEGNMELTPEKENHLAKELIQTHLKDFAPYLYDEYQKDMVSEVAIKGIEPIEIDTKAKKEILEHGHPLSVFHGGKQGGNPYAVLCSEKEGNMCFVYGAATVQADVRNEHLGLNGNGSLGYAFGMSSHNKRNLKVGQYEMGFLYEYEARKDKQEMLFIDTAGNYYSGGKFDKDQIRDMRDETAILPHQNKLKKIYVATRSSSGDVKLLPLDVDEKGKIIDKKWRNFVEMYNPIDDNISGNMAKRRNNMIEQYDTLGKDGMYRSLETLQNRSQQAQQTTQTMVKPEKKQEITQPVNQAVLSAIQNRLAR